MPGNVIDAFVLVFSREVKIRRTIKLIFLQNLLHEFQKYFECNQRVFNIYIFDIKEPSIIGRSFYIPFINFMYQVILTSYDA